MTIDLNSLAFIDKIAASILTSKLSSSAVNLTRDQIYSLAVSSYQFATVVHQVREDFKTERGIVEQTEELPLWTILNLVSEAEKKTTGDCCCCKSSPEKDVAVKEVEEEKLEEVEEVEEEEEILVEVEEDIPVKRKRGRPKGSVKVTKVVAKKRK